tara:strand:+ start:603 stop:740 length:138 start_codon:yes stop_codon:yes gene_type:complete
MVYSSKEYENSGRYGFSDMVVFCADDLAGEEEEEPDSEESPIFYL